MLITALNVVHVLAATVWVGGTVALVFAAVPVIRLLEGESRASSLAALGRRWRPFGWGSLAVLAGTGAANARLNHAFAGASIGFDSLLSVKLVLFVCLLGTAYVHDYVLGPALARQIRASQPQTLRRPLVLVGWTSFALTVTIPVLGVVLAELGP